MANIIEIYEKYYIPKHLQLHMLRVAACAKLILDNWVGEEIDKKAILGYVYCMIWVILLKYKKRIYKIKGQ